ncbi:MAG: hypothetical protein Q9227_000310 [Pyrenula ochraceoflavens]
MLSRDTSDPQPLHDYYPLGLELVDYVANVWSFQILLAIFGAGCVMVLGTTYLVTSQVSPGLSKIDRLTVLWFVLTGTIHLFFEGYFAINHTRMAPAQDLFGQLWKEYAYSDSRYLTSDPFVLCMESITAICWGPLSYLTAHMIASQSSFRFPIQAIVSLGQIYGDVLYYATSLFDLYYKNLVYSRPEAYYFWGYFVLINSIWIIPRFSDGSFLITDENKKTGRSKGCGTGINGEDKAGQKRIVGATGSVSRAIIVHAANATALCDPMQQDPRSTSSTPTQNSSVRDRVRAWQEHGGGVVTTSFLSANNSTSSLSQLSDPQPLLSGKQEQAKDETPKNKTKSTDTEATAKRKNTVWVNPETREWVRRPRSNSTPRKRVVSDEHWKAKRSPPKSSEITPKTPTRRRETPRDVPRSPNPAPKVSENVRTSLTKEDQEYRRQRKKQEREREVYGDSIAKSKNIDEDVIVVEEDSGQDDAADGKEIALVSQSRRKGVQSRRRKGDEELPLEKDDGRHRRRSDISDMRESPLDPVIDAFTELRGSTKSRKTSLLSQVLDESRKMFSKPDPTIPAPRLPSIEAWLDETPDPFTDQGTVSLADIPAPLKTRSRRQPRTSENLASPSPEVHIADKDQDSENPEQKNSGRRRRRRSRPHLEEASPSDNRDARSKDSPVENADPSSPADSPSALKRSSARVHRRKRRETNSAKHQSSASAEPAKHDLPPPPSEDSFDASQIPWRSRKTCPQTGANRLSTIASIETLQPREADHVALGQNELKRKLTTHEDLMSVLSLPHTRRSTRSKRSHRPRDEEQKHVTVDQLLQDFSIDETKYTRELKTLVDGVIPVLLQCVLSKSDSAAAAGIFALGDSQDDKNYTKPIVDMGICLERLRTLHKRAPRDDGDLLLTWALGAEKIYTDYLKAWRLGFQDIVVNLTPADDEAKSRMNRDMCQDGNGDWIDEDGEKADVAYLLKRPLVRVKKLHKLFSEYNTITSSSRGTKVSSIFQELTEFARQRSNDEQGRLEDQAAARIDVKRARDLHMMTVAEQIKIEPSRSVKARDRFNLTLLHSTGQRYDCYAELLLRDDREGLKGGDLLVCEVDKNERWLLFPPFETSLLSARVGDVASEAVIMIRLATPFGSDFYELLTIQAGDETTILDWVSMLGSIPLPPKLHRSQSVINHEEQQNLFSNPAPSRQGAVSPTFSTVSKASVLSPRDVDVPIGEQATAVGLVHEDEPLSGSSTPLVKSQRQLAENYQPGEGQASPIPGMANDSSGLRRSRALSHRPRRESEPVSPATGIHKYFDPGSPRSAHDGDAVQGSSNLRASPGFDKTPQDITDSSTVNNHDRPKYHRAPSSTPSSDLPSIPRTRPSNQSSVSLNQSMLDQWTTIRDQQSSSLPEAVHRLPQQSRIEAPFTEDVPIPPVHRSSTSRPNTEQAPPPPPHRVATSPQPAMLDLKGQKVPTLSRKGDRRSSSPLKHEYAPSTASDTSSDSDSTLDDFSSETSEDDDEAGDKHMPLPSLPFRPAQKLSSPSSAPTLASATLGPSNSASQAPYRTVPTHPSIKGSKSIATIFGWSDRGMWNQLHADECSVIVTPGLISAYHMTAAHSEQTTGTNPKTVSGTTSDISSYDHEENPQQHQPLIALELTPLVPLRRGTALDISIRSPPTASSRIRHSNNIMFRSRSADECEALYNLINYARINNPTYIALQNARPSIQPPVNFDINAKSSRARSATAKSGSWLFGSGRGPSSFRASSAPPPGSITAGSDNSLATSFTSAMRRFGTSNMFSLNRSSVLRKSKGSGTPSLYSTETGTTGTGGSGSGSNSPAPSQMLLNAIAGAEKTLGINNVKIRLYTREVTGQPWLDLGSARLSVLPAPDDLANSGLRSPPPLAGQGGSRPVSSAGVYDLERTPRASTQKGPRLPSSSYTPHRTHGNGHEKRILIVAKSRSKSKPPPTLLDACLGESCFERVGRIGIAVSVWKEDEEVKKVGGVNMGKETIFMLQFNGEAEATWIFGSVDEQYSKFYEAINMLKSIHNLRSLPMKVRKSLGCPGGLGYLLITRHQLVFLVDGETAVAASAPFTEVHMPVKAFVRLQKIIRRILPIYLESQRDRERIVVAQFRHRLVNTTFAVELMISSSESPPPFHHSPATSDKDRFSTRDSTPISTPVGYSPSIARRPGKEKDLLWSWHKKPNDSSLYLDSALLEPDFDEPLFPLFDETPKEPAMAGAAAPIDIATRQASSSPRGHQTSNLTSALQGANGLQPPSTGHDPNELSQNVFRRPSSFGNQSGEGTKPISFRGPGSEDRARRESVAASLTNGMSWGGVSVGSWIRDDIMMSGTSPFTFQSPPNYQSSSYQPKFEAQFMKDFFCCGKTLPSLHDLLQHYEESHAERPPSQQNRQINATGQAVPDSRAAIATNTAAAVQQQAQQNSVAPQQVNTGGPTGTNRMAPNAIGSTTSQLQSIPDMDTVEDMEMDDAIEETDAATPPSNLYMPQQGQDSGQSQYAQSNLPRLAPLNVNALPQFQGFRSSTPTTPTTAGRTNVPLSNNPTVSSVNTPTLMANPAQQHLQDHFRTPESSAPGTPVELDENIMSGLDGMTMQANLTGQGPSGGLAGFPTSNDMLDLCIDEPAKRLFTSSGGNGNAQPYAHFRLGGNQYSADSDIAKRIREQQMLAGLPDTASGIMPNDEPKPFRCPVIGCEKAYKNQNGLKYHKAHGHNNQRLHDNADGTFSIVNPETSTPYPGTMGMEREKPYKCETCGKRYKNLNGLKYHKSHSPPCNPELHGRAAATTGAIMMPPTPTSANPTSGLGMVGTGLPTASTEIS